MRELTIPYADGDIIGKTVTLTVEACVIRIDAELIMVSPHRVNPEVLPGEPFTTFVVTKAVRHGA